MIMQIDKNTYFNQCKEVLAILTEKQEFEACKQLVDLMDAIETKNVKKYIRMEFDIQGMRQMGIFKKGQTYDEMAQSICLHFGYKEVYEYSYQEGFWDSYVRYANEIYDIIRKVEF